MSRTFSANLGSFDSLMERVRCGLSPCSFHTRCTVVCPTPSSAASKRALQCVAFAGFSLAVRVTILSRTASLMRFLPGARALALVLAQTLDAGHVRLLPAPHRWFGNARLAHDRIGACTAPRQQHDLGSLDDLLRTCPSPGTLYKFSITG